MTVTYYLSLFGYRVIKLQPLSPGDVINIVLAVLTLIAVWIALSGLRHTRLEGQERREQQVRDLQLWLDELGRTLSMLDIGQKMLMRHGVAFSASFFEELIVKPLEQWQKDTVRSPFSDLHDHLHCLVRYAKEVSEEYQLLVSVLDKGLSMGWENPPEEMSPTVVGIGGSILRHAQGLDAYRVRISQCLRGYVRDGKRRLPELVDAGAADEAMSSASDLLERLANSPDEGNPAEAAEPR